MKKALSHADDLVFFACETRASSNGLGVGPADLGFTNRAVVMFYESPKRVLFLRCSGPLFLC